MIARIFTFRRSLLLLGVTVAGLAFPAAMVVANASARDTAKKAPTVILKSGTTKSNKGFNLRLFAYQAPGLYGGITRYLTVYMTRKSGHATQTAEYIFSSHVKMTAAKHQTSGTIKGKLPGGRGSIRMTFHSTSRSSKARGACGGSKGSKRSGTLSGSMTLKADKLGTVKLRSIQATWSSATYLCPGPPSPHTCPSKGYLLEAPHATYLCFSKPTAKSRVSEVIELVKGGSSGFGAYYVYAVANAPSRDYKVGAKLASASLKGAGGIRGQAVYSAKKKSKRQTHGKLTGTLSVKIAALGLVQPFAKAKHHVLSADQRHSKH